MYDQCGIWYIVDILRQSLQRFALTDVFSSERNAIEVTGIIHIVDATEWSAVPPEQPYRGLQQDCNRSPGHGTAARDCILFDPWEWSRISVEEVADLCRLLR